MAYEAGAGVQRVELAWSRAVNDTWLQLWGVALAAAWGDLAGDHRRHMDPALVALMDGALDVSAVAHKQTEALRTRLWHDLARILDRCDAVLCPTCAVPAPGPDTTEADFDKACAPAPARCLRSQCSPVTSSSSGEVAKCTSASIPVSTAPGESRSDAVTT